MVALDYTGAVGGAAPVYPRPRSARGGAVFFMVLLASLGWRAAGSSSAFFFFLLFSVVLFLPSSFSGVHRPSRGCWAFFGWLSFAADLAVSLLPPSGGRLDHRLGVFIALICCPSSSIKYAQTSILFASLQIFS